MGIALNDFKSLLGNVNDGNIVFKEDGSGLEKANHGNALTRKLYNYRQVPSDRIANGMIRQALMDAISNSAEGRALSNEQIAMIRDMLGIGDEKRRAADLTRVELKAVLDTVELMVRGENPDRNDAGRVRASIKGIPSVDGNLLVKGQIDRLGKIGYPPEKCRQVLELAKKHTQDVSKIFNKSSLEALFGKGFDGHTKKEMVIFVRNSAASIQSQIFDKLFWKYLDAVENHPNENRVTVGGGMIKDVFLEVVREMTADYAEGREPLPKTDLLLDRPDSPIPVLPQDPNADPAVLAASLGKADDPVALAGAEFLKGACGRIDDVMGGLVESFRVLGRLSTSGSVGFASRQMQNFVAQIGVQLNSKLLPFRPEWTTAFKKDFYATFKTTYEATQGTVGEKRQAAVEAVNKAVVQAVAQIKQIKDSLFGDSPVLTALSAFDAKLMTACFEKSSIAKGFRQMIADVLARLPPGSAALDNDTLAFVVDQVRAKSDRLFDTGPIARSIAVKLGYPKTDEAMVGAIRDKLGELTGDFAKDIVEQRAVLAEALLTDPTADVDALAAEKIKDALVDRIRKDLGENIDPAKVQAARDEQFGKAAELTTSYGDHGNLADTCIVTKAEVEKKKQEMRDEIDAMRNLEGKLAGLENDLKNIEAKQPPISQLEEELKAIADRIKQSKAYVDAPDQRGRTAVIRADPDYTGKAEVLKERRDELKMIQRKVKSTKGDIRLRPYNLRLKEMELASYESKHSQAYFDVVENSVFRGKVALACECGLFDRNPALKALVTDRTGRQIKITPDNYIQVRDGIDALFADKTLVDLELMTGYIREGFSHEDRLNFNQNFSNDPGLFRAMYLDGRLDFKGVDPLARKYLMDGISYDIRSKVLDIDMSLTVRDYFTKDLFEAFYKELRTGLIDAVNAAKAKGQDVDLETVLAESSLAGEEPLDFADPEINSKFKYDSAYHDPENKTRLSINLIKRDWGFGTSDPAAIRDTLLRVGLTQKDLNTTEGWLKAHRLSVIIHAHGGRAAGAVEWAERVTGKSFDDIRLGDLIGIASSTELNEAIADPMDDLKGDLSTVARFLSGQITLDEANLKPDDMPNFLQSLRQIAKGKTDTANVSLFGKNFTVSKCANGVLTAKLDVGGGKMMSIGVARPLPELIAQIENQAVDHADKFTPDVILAILPKSPESGELIARPRELYSKTLSTLLNLPSVNFSHLSTKDLYDTVRRALDPQTDRKALAKTFETLPTSYNNAETVELQAKLLKASELDLGAVKLPKTVDVRSPAERAHDFISELVMNADTWTYDAGMKTPGQRILSLAGSDVFRKDITYLQNHSELLDELPAILREGVGGILKDLYTLVGKLDGMDGNQAKLAACAEFETKIDAFVETSMKKMQTEASKLFSLSKNDERANWQKGLGEMSGTGGLSESTSQGRFTKRVLDNYFKSCHPIEQRAMLANILRNTDKDSSRGKLVGEMMKGAGPLLQKTLQGLPANTFGPETQLALKDMKSKLLPISDSVIQANLLELIRSSNGEILSIEVKKSLGQATVGQALLCHIRTKSHPVSGEDVVIKILRPNVQTAVQREYKTFLDIAAELDKEEHTGNSQQETFKGRYQTVLKEFDFTLESANIDLCLDIYEKPTASFYAKKKEVEKYDTLHSMDRHHAVPPMSGALLLQKVEGKPVDRLLEDSRAEVDAILGDIKQTTQLGDDPATKKTVYRAKTAAQAVDVKYKLWNKREELLEQHKELTKLVDIWMEKALFGDGVFHNDLHPGNVMINGRQVSVIDFGNVGRLNKGQQTSLVFLFAAAMTGDVDDYVKGVEDLLGGEIKDGPKKALKTALTDVFAKGSSADVLPRMLAALSALKDNSIAIPEVIHNFAESMARLQSVVDGVVDEILNIETVSNRITIEDGCLDKFTIDPKWGDIPLEVFDGLKTMLASIGTSDKPFDVVTFETACKKFLDDFDNGNYRESFLKTLNDKVFKQEDHGVAFFRDVIGTMRELPFSTVMADVSSSYRGRITSVVEHIEDDLSKYDAAYESKDAEMIEKAQANFANVFLNMFVSFVMNIRNGIPEDTANRGPMIFRSANPDRFVGCINKTLEKRKNMLVQKMGAFLELPEGLVNGLIAHLNVPGAPMPKEAAAYLLKLNKLQNLGDKLGDAEDAKDKGETLMRFFAWKGHGLTEAELEKNTIGDPLTMLESEKVRSCAWEFRYPQSWTPPRQKIFFVSESDETYKARVKKEIETRDDDKEKSVKGAGGIKEMRLVFQTNLDALKKALGVEKLTVRQIAYFAQMSVATTRYQPFGELLVGYDDKKLTEIAGGDADLKLYLTKLQSSVNDVIEQEIKEAEEKKAKKK